VAVLRSIPQLESLAAEWNSLADRAGHALLRHEWFLSAARTLHAQDAIAVVTNRDGSGRLSGVAPLVERRAHGHGRMELLGSSALHEPAGFLCADGAAQTSLLESVFELGQTLMLQRMVPECLASIPLGRSTSRHGILLSRPAPACLGLEFDASAAAFLDRLSGKLRYDLRRAWTRAGGNGSVRFEALAPTRGELDSLFDEFLAIEAAGWKGRRGSALAVNPTLRAFFRFYCERTAEEGTLRMFRLLVGGKAVAVQMAVEMYRRLWVLKIGYDESMARCSPGLLLTGEAIRYALDRGLQSYEFLGGIEPWEERWRPRRREHQFLLFYPWTVAGCIGVSIDAVGAGWRHVKRAAGLNARRIAR
jgi:CelD/BcsL family acetyltransferase involved in cellulose biosynthesis